MPVKTEDGSEYLLALARANGAAVATVSDGHVFLFSRERLESMLRESDSDILSIFVKRAPKPSEQQ